jgi:membrane fusion protein, heavy metal efflux system
MTIHRGSSVLMMLALAGCHSHPHSGVHDEGPDDPGLSFTHWTDETELFLELAPTLIRDRDSMAAVHVTVLEGFRALGEGPVTVVLRGKDGAERFVAERPAVPGLFRVPVKPRGVGPRELLVEVTVKAGLVTHRLGEVTVFETSEAARQGTRVEKPAAGRIPYLKEQQWQLGFGTAVATSRAVRPMLRVTGNLIARSDGEVVVTAPVAGRLGVAGRAFPRLGDRVAVDDLLGVLAPRLEAADLASLELAVTSAELELRFSERERQRLEALRGEGAVPERRVLDAIRATEAAQASLSAAQRRLEQFRRSHVTAGRGEGAVQLRAPLAGVITEVRPGPGTFVEAGAVLFRVTDVARLWLEVRVPEVDVARVGTPAGASFLVEGVEEPFEVPASALVARGHRVDPHTQSLPLMFSVDNPDGRLPVGAFARVRLVTGPEREVLCVPETALVDDSGAFVVFVQVSGEAFERRLVRLGARDRGFVEVLSGVAAGERVVSRGAWSVKLAASSGAVPAHGHEH